MKFPARGDGPNRLTGNLNKTKAFRCAHWCRPMVVNVSITTPAGQQGGERIGRLFAI